MTAVQTPISKTRGVRGRFVSDGRGDLYEIEGVERMRPFLVPLVSDSTLWAYFSSVGGVAAGRISPECALFGYETDDRLHVADRVSGPVTGVLAPGAESWWFPFVRNGPRRVRRSIAKCGASARLVLTEREETLGITARVEWSTSDEHGLVRESSLMLDEGREPIEVVVIDGLRNVLPPDIALGLQQSMSTLVDAYKRAELIDGRIGVFALESAIGDSPTSEEATRCALVWRYGLDGATTTLRDEDWYSFSEGRDADPDAVVLGQRTSYLVRARVRLGPGEAVRWGLVADTAIDHAELVRRLDGLRDGSIGAETVLEGVRASSERLRSMLANSDGGQRTADRTADAHHLANVLFNTMRGGTFAADTIDMVDLRLFLRAWDRRVHASASAGLDGLGPSVTREVLVGHAEKTGDADLIRLMYEYLPLTFSRRHGDPSRPWNHFRIRLRDAAGRRAFGYEGNWRDIFQNWETLCFSFPRWTASVVTKFVNASTADGFNPYRLSHEGIDWERPEPSSPWGDLGYWGDHQIAYLHRLLVLAEHVDPGWLESSLGRRVFTYADVPYRIKPYKEIVRDPKHTITFDRAAEAETLERVASVGADGRLLHDSAGRIVRVTLAEKLLVPFLSKVCNMLPGGGIWMNTQRPEWNDANNALVGYGLSVVTLFYARAYARFCLGLLEDSGLETLALSRGVADWCDGVVRVLISRLELLEDGAGPGEMRVVLDELGEVFGEYRAEVYRDGPGAATEFPAEVASDMLRLAIRYFDRTITASRREDGLFDSYNLLSPEDEGVSPLQEMLEGQVAAIASGALGPDEVADLVERMFASRLYRPDQHSFVLYPVVERPAFLDRNRVPEEMVARSPLLSRLAKSGAGRLVVRDAHGTARFGAHLRTARDVEAALDRLGEIEEWTNAVDAGRSGALEAYEEVFGHQRFTGRSGTMYKYEGIGSVYWHMVSKLLLAVQEATIAAQDDAPASAAVGRLVRLYFRIRSGLCFNKTPDEYGAFPIDPYSHTPWHSGAQQPGTTGQVKEGVLIRFGELGVRVRAGRVAFRPTLLRAGEFLGAPERWTPGPGFGPVELPAGSLGFTYAGTPVVYRVVEDAAEIEVTCDDGSRRAVEGDELPADVSRELLDRSGRIRKLRVGVPRHRLLTGVE